MRAETKPIHSAALNLWQRENKIACRHRDDTAMTRPTGRLTADRPDGILHL
jgi:hypothetical protein